MMERKNWEMPHRAMKNAAAATNLQRFRKQPDCPLEEKATKAVMSKDVTKSYRNLSCWKQGKHVEKAQSHICFALTCCPLLHLHASFTCFTYSQWQVTWLEHLSSSRAVSGLPSHIHFLEWTKWIMCLP